MAKLFVSLDLNELSCFVNNGAISEAAWPQFSQSSHSCSRVAHLTPSPGHALQPQVFESVGVRGVKGQQPWENRAQLPSAISADLFTWKLSLKGISFLLPYLGSDTALFFKKKKKKGWLHFQSGKSAEHALFRLRISSLKWALIKFPLVPP